MNKYEAANLISRKMLGVASAEEEAALEKWLVESEENRQIHDDIVSRSVKNHIAKPEDETDIVAVKNQIRAGINRRLRRKRISIWGAAAAVLVAASLPLALDRGDNSDESYLRGVYPTGYSAQLILEDGSRILLGENTADIGRTDLSVVASGNTLVYTQEEPADELIFNTIEIPAGAEYNLRLADGTRIHLNPETRIRYPKAFTGDAREVWLSGEAYFEVTPSSKPFLVHSGEMKVSVLGTSFNVTAYDDNGFLETTLVEGSVRVDNINTGKGGVISPGQQLRMFPNGEAVVRFVDTAKYTAWKDNVLIFDHETFGDIARTLSRWYKVDISIESDELVHTTFYGKLPKYENISDILDMMRKVHNFKYETSDGKITLKESR